METHTIMYIGLQLDSPVRDRPNGRPDREWHGPGSVVADIPTIQASKLLLHSKEWEDVSKLVEVDLTKRAAAAKAHSEERVRASRQGNGSAAVNVRAIPTDILKAELDRRLGAQADIDAGEGVEGRSDIETQPKTEGANARASDERFVIEKILESVETIMEREGNDDSLDESGLPTLEAVQEVVGFSLNQDEYARALEHRQ